MPPSSRKKVSVVVKIALHTIFICKPDRTAILTQRQTEGSGAGICLEFETHRSFDFMFWLSICLEDKNKMQIIQRKNMLNL